MNKNKRLSISSHGCLSTRTALSALVLWSLCMHAMDWNLRKDSKPKHVRDVGKCLPWPGTKCFCLNCLFQAVWKNLLLRSSSAPQIFTSPTHTGQANTFAWFPPWLICHWQEAKRMQTNNGAACALEYWQLLCLGVTLYLACTGNSSLFMVRSSRAVWRKF